MINTTTTYFFILLDKIYMNSSACASANPICTKTHTQAQKINLEGTLPICKPLNRKEVMIFYGINSYTTFKKLIRPIEDKIQNKGRFFFPPQLRIIREFFDGVPVDY